MRKLLLLSAGLPVLGFTLACSGMATGGNDNVTPCKEYVKHYNSLECIPDSAKFVPDEYCPEALNMSPKDLTPFYECQKENAKCDGKTPDLGGMSKCKM